MDITEFKTPIRRKCDPNFMRIRGSNPRSENPRPRISLWRVCFCSHINVDFPWRTVHYDKYYFYRLPNKNPPKKKGSLICPVRIYCLFFMIEKGTKSRAGKSRYLTNNQQLVFTVLNRTTRPQWKVGLSTV